MLKKIAISSLLFSSLSGVALAWNSAPTGTYLVTLTNTSYGHGFSFPVAATHPSGLRVFQVGQLASTQAAAVAQTGNPGPMFNFLAGKQASGEVTDVYGHPFPMAAKGASTAPWPSGLPFYDALSDTPGLKPTTTGHTLTSSISFTINANSKDYLSLIMMMMCTNDGLAGLDAVELPANQGDTKIYNMFAYDAGVEQNTELAPDIVDPCGLMAPYKDGKPQVSTSDGNRNSPPTASQTPPSTATDPSIQTTDPIALYTTTIAGKGDVPANFAWSPKQPVGVVTITRIDGNLGDPNYSYDTETQLVNIADVLAYGKHYQIKLRSQGNKTYALNTDSIKELGAQTNSHFGQYDDASGVLTLPSVDIGARKYRAILKNVGNFVFVLERLEESDSAYVL